MGLDCRVAGKRATNKLRRRQAIVEIAARSFLDHGYSGTSMSGIATDLGGSKSTLWCYFPSKEDLFAAVLDDATCAFREQLAGVLSLDGPLAETLLAFCRRFISKVTSPEGCGLHRLVVAESGRFPEIGRIFASRVPEPVRQMLARYFDSQMAADTMSHDDPTRAAQALTNLCLGDLHQRTLWHGFQASAEDVEAEAEFATAVFLRAYATAPR